MSRGAPHVGGCGPNRRLGETGLGAYDTAQPERPPRRSETANVAKARGIVKRRKAVQNIRKITRTMQLIATARFQRTFNRAVATRPFTEKITELVRELSADREQIDHPLLRANTGTDRCALLVITSNRGLCGGYNGNLLRTAVGFIRAQETPQKRGAPSSSTSPGRRG
jgi:F-type H+-transporting ATPase subunit gamma